MQFALADIMTWISGLMWPFMRIGAMFMVAPMFGARNVPVRLRLLLALVLAWVMSLVLPPPPAVDPISLEAVVISIQQVVIGLAMGFILQMVFSVLAMAGENIAYGMGLGFATLVDPENGVQVPVVGQYFLILATLMFLGLDGHLILIEMLAESFRSLPVGGVGMERDVFWLIAGWGSRMFEWSLLVSLPVVASLLLVNISFGIITRAAPQLNIFAVGFPLTLLLGFALMLVSLPTLGPLFESLAERGFLFMRGVLGL